MKTSFVSICLLIQLAVFCVFAAPQNKPSSDLGNGCFWSECKSIFTYDLKCPFDHSHDQNPDTSDCKQGLGKFKCCPEDPSGSGSSSSSPSSSDSEQASGAGGSSPVVPEAV